MESVTTGSKGAERLPLDAGALATYLAVHLPGFAGPLDVRQFSGGQSNPTYRLDTPGRTYVLRRKPPGDLLPSAHRIDREYRVMEALGRVGFPVPGTLLYCEDRDVIGAEFFVMAHVEGRVLFDTRMPGLGREKRAAICHALVDTLADLHCLDVAAAGLADFGREGGYLLRQTRRWSEQYRASATAEIPAMERLMAALPSALAEVPDETCLVHGDYRLDNVILAADAPRVAAVLDWELATLGHPLGDLAYYLMTWAFPADLRWGLAETDLADLGIPSMDALAARYAARTGRAAVPGLDLLVAYNAFRMAAILQGVYRRGLDGNAADEAALSMGEDVPRLAAVADAMARRAGV
jgi:aminoglycoside phosphotransferase (APT) family kinase protein